VQRPSTTTFTAITNVCFKPEKVGACFCIHRSIRVVRKRARSASEQVLVRSGYRLVYKGDDEAHLTQERLIRDNEMCLSSQRDKCTPLRWSHAAEPCDKATSSVIDNVKTVKHLSLDDNTDKTWLSSGST